MFDAATGELRWRVDVPGQSVKTPVPFDGILYFDHVWGLMALTSPERAAYLP